MIFFCIPGPDDQNWWNRKNCPKFFHRVIFCVLNSNLQPKFMEIRIHFEIQLILRNWSFFAFIGPDDQNRWNRKNCPKLFYRVIFAFWIKICHSNLCKSHIFWITANIEKCSFFAYPDLMTKIDEIGKIARNCFIG